MIEFPLSLLIFYNDHAGIPHFKRETKPVSTLKACALYALWLCSKAYYFSSVLSLSHIQLFATPWTGARQASLFITNSRSLLKLMSIKLVMPSNHLILFLPLLLLPSIFPSIRVFSNESVLHIKWPNIGVSASASVIPMNIQNWFLLGWTGWMSLLSKRISRVFSNTRVQKLKAI